MITINGVILNVKSFTPTYESGIEWKRVGTKLHAIDYGVNSDHYSSTIVLDGSYVDIIDAYDYLIATVGSSIDITDTTNIFGMWVTATKARVATISKPVLQFNNVCTLEVKLYAVNRSYSVASVPFNINSLLSQSITRSIDTNTAINMLEFGTDGIDVGDDVNTTDIILMGQKSIIGGMTRYLTEYVRSSDITIAPTNMWLFNDNVYSNICKVTSISDVKAYDRAGNWWQIQISLSRVS